MQLSHQLHEIKANHLRGFCHIKIKTNKKKTKKNDNFDLQRICNFDRVSLFPKTIAKNKIAKKNENLVRKKKKCQSTLYCVFHVASVAISN